MKSFDQFIADYNGKYVDFPGGARNQCVDLVLQYNKECVGAPIIWGNAKDLFYNADSKYYTTVKNTATAIPPKGAIMCMDGRVGNGNGHTGVVLDGANVLTYSLFNQNWPIGTPAHAQKFNNLYYAVIGWLVPKVQTPPVQPPTSSQAIEIIKSYLTQSLSGDQFRDKVKSLLGV